MTQERKLKLVHSAPSSTAGDPSPGPDPSPEAPPTEEERAHAEELRAALERGDEPVSSSLRAAWQPPALDPPDHEALLARALGDVDAPPTAAEERAAALLRSALEPPRAEARTRARLALEGSAEESLAALAQALRVAVRPTPLAPHVHEALVARAVAHPARKARSRVVPIAMSAVAAALALAAGFMFSFQARSPERSSSAQAVAPGAAAVRADGALIRVRSTDDLFDPAAPFPREGGESARIDRIAVARAADLRANRFASWGVR